ncbi:MAG: nuclear transport factor 2 family protein [Pseudomonadota bacterium]|jgi:hypothetical protein
MNSAERDAIAAVVARYIGSWYAGDHATMAACLHPGLLKRRICTDREGGLEYLNALHRDEMVAATEAGIGVRRAAAFEGVRVEVLAIDGRIASATATCAEWIDHLHLVRDEAGWRIVHALYTAPPRTP